MSCETTINIEDGDIDVVVLEEEQVEVITFDDDLDVIIEECS